MAGAFMLKRRASWFAVVTLGAALCGCGHSSSTRTPSSTGTAARSTMSAGDVPSDMVSAVSPGGSATPIAMKFRLTTPPVVGSPVQVDVALIPATDVAISHIHATFSPGDGLQVQSDRNVDITDPRPGEVVVQTVTVVPQQVGVLSLTATVLVELDTGSIARTYTVPLIAVPPAS